MALASVAIMHPSSWHLAVAAVAWVFLTAGCDGGCPDGQAKQPVYTSTGERTSNYVCIAESDLTPPTSSTSASTLPEAAPPPTDASTPPPQTCATVDATGPEVAVAQSAGLIPALVGPTPPPGTYGLVRATAYSAESTPLAVSMLRGALVVATGALTFGGQAAQDQPYNESFSFGLAPNMVTRICQTGQSDGALAMWLFPESMQGGDFLWMVWDASLNELTLRISDSVDLVVDLVFVPA
jgi:hypothetical protein